jgi:hypothetical protein
MDQMTVLLPDEPEAARAGDEVVFIGRSDDERILAEDVARLLGTINYEIACDVSPRVVRRYVETPAGTDAARGPSRPSPPARSRAPRDMNPTGEPADSA